MSWKVESWKVESGERPCDHYVGFPARVAHYCEGDFSRIPSYWITAPNQRTWAEPFTCTWCNEEMPKDIRVAWTLMRMVE
jgi:hypothetical protein